MLITISRPLKSRLGNGRRSAVLVRPPTAADDTPARSNRPDVRNPLLALSTVRALQQAGAAERAALAMPLRQLQRECAAAAQRDWFQREFARAALFKAAGVYAGHLCQALVAPGMPPLLAERARRRRLDPKTELVLLEPRDRGERRNVLLRLPAARTLLNLPPPAKAQLAGVLAEFCADGRRRSDEAWRSNKAPIAFYNFAASSYARHLRGRLLEGCNQP